MKKAKDMSMKHESMESKADEAKETRLEKKGYVETKSGKMKKAFIGGMFKKSSTATPSGGGSGGGDQLNSVLGALLGSKFGRGLKNKNVTYSGDMSGQTTGGKQTGQVTAKQMGGMVRGGRAEIKGLRPAKLS